VDRVNSSQNVQKMPDIRKMAISDKAGEAGSNLAEASENVVYAKGKNNLLQFK
jgi:hypothetical protein